MVRIHVGQPSQINNLRRVCTRMWPEQLAKAANLRAFVEAAVRRRCSHWTACEPNVAGGRGRDEKETSNRIPVFSQRGA
jgi:hypothetical protein